ncbi:uncharacterized membrane protein YcaP (DUF421 family) [Cytobacillus oceanisediminis]|jgi:uncharacterized membrane protein YcaP (DUF421 family)|uniref:Uncharacterized membrane protein YcaP (DUF421 family) n=1 Tax=Cytobacillus oceanisediminis TaxID=665099 RepID=A0A2V2ZLI6_9BACI|nr:DUF421 domain-containing protein [Cytobacillus oceanisediminis]PWW20532.1 uncharacterized membrane protein YcaP (DUF421 family) [Cytobacillus oceanisediminis]
MYLSITIKMVVGLVSLLAVTRLLGKKELSQVTPFDFLYAVVLGGIVEETIYDNKVTPLQVAYSAVLWAGLIYIIEILAKKNNFFRSILKGSESIIVKDGKLNVREMQKNHLEMEQLRTMLRQRGIFSMNEVKYAYLETNGGLSVMKYRKEDPVTPEMMGMDTEDIDPSILLIDEGEVVDSGLRLAGKDGEWLKDSIKKAGYNDIKDVFCAEWSEKEGFYIVTYKK